MNGVKLRTVLLVAGKELRESLRDRRTLFVALLLPVLLYPLMMLVLAPLVNQQKQKLKDEAQPVVVTGAGAAALRDLLTQAATPEGKPPLAPGALRFEASDAPERDLAEGRIALWVEVTDDLAGLVDGARRAPVVVHPDGSSDQSMVAEKKFNEAMSALGEAVLQRRESKAGLPPDWHRPFAVERRDVAPPERRAAWLFGKILAFILVVLTLSSSFYPAVDAVAGEKERGTMETLLVAPCGRAELVLGKFAAVLAVTLAAAILNLASMALTLGPFGKLIAPELGAGLRITPTVLVGVLALLVPLSALFSAVSLALSTLARSVKEGQHYLTPLFLVVMPLAMVVILPDVPLTASLAPVPVTNAVLFFRDLLLGKTSPGITAIVMVSTFAYAAAALWGCVSLFLREETLFRGPEGGTAMFPRPAPRDTPGAAAALFLFAACLALVWYGQPWLPQKDIVANVVASQALLIFAPCALLTLWLRVRPSTTFLVRTPPLLGVAAAVLIGLAAPVLNSALVRLVGEPSATGPMQEIQEAMTAFVKAHPAASVLVFAVLPAVCEELFFRGFVLGGLRSSMRGGGAAARAAVISSVLFAVFHIYPEKWAPTFLMGLVLAFLAIRTGSLLPGIVAHTLNNASAVLVALPPVAELVEKVPGGAGLAAAGVAFAAGLIALLLTRRAASAETPLS